MDEGPVYATKAVSIGETETEGSTTGWRYWGGVDIESMPAACGTCWLRHSRWRAFVWPLRSRNLMDGWTGTVCRGFGSSRRMTRGQGHHLHGVRVVSCWGSWWPSGSSGVAGEVLSTGPEGLVVQAGAGRLCITYLQQPGGKPMSWDACMRGHPRWIVPGVRLG